MLCVLQAGGVLKPGTTGGMALRIDCDQCTFTATTSQQMIKHKQNRHEGLAKKVGKLRCPFCDYRNSYQKVMELHIKAHEGELKSFCLYLLGSCCNHETNMNSWLDVVMSFAIGKSVVDRIDSHRYKYSS